MKPWLTALWAAVALGGHPTASAIQPEPPATIAAGELVEGVECQADSSQTYTLYLPSAFAPERRWPALLIFDPRGRSVAAAELFRPAAEEYGWILLSSNDTRSDGPIEPNLKALNALWPEVHLRHSIDPHRIYAAGFSGGAMLAWALGRQSGELAGVIASGGRLESFNEQEKIEFASFGAAGSEDFNYSEMRSVHERLERWGAPERLEMFDGSHTWMPRELARLGVEWLEVQAIKEGRRASDEALIRRLYESDLEAAGRLEAEGRLLEAMRRYAAVADTFDELLDIDRVRDSAKRLEKDPAVARERKQEKKSDNFERAYLDRANATIAALRNEGSAMTPGRFAAQLDLARLQERASKPGYEGVVARRLLRTVLTWTSFYLTQEFFAQEDFSSAVTVLTTASVIDPTRSDVWYNLACAEARWGHEAKAVAALERAVESGFGDLGQLTTDPDLESIRDHQSFRELVAELGG